MGRYLREARHQRSTPTTRLTIPRRAAASGRIPIPPDPGNDSVLVPVPWATATAVFATSSTPNTARITILSNIMIYLLPSRSLKNHSVSRSECGHTGGLDLPHRDGVPQSEMLLRLVPRWQVVACRCIPALRDSVSILCLHTLPHNLCTRTAQNLFLASCSLPAQAVVQVWNLFHCGPLVGTGSHQPSHRPVPRSFS